MILIPLSRVGARTLGPDPRLPILGPSNRSADSSLPRMPPPRPRAASQPGWDCHPRSRTALP
eukprot:2269799-Alexandrium_andersonii.AAC.1